MIINQRWDTAAKQLGLSGGGGGVRWTPFTGMGDVIPDGSQAGDLGEFTVSALGVIQKIENFLHIGTGHMEADRITPIQNDVFLNVVKPITDNVNLYGSTLSYQTLSAMWNAIEAVKAKWLTFLHSTNWSDGRAAAQAEETLAPYFSDIEAKIQHLLQTASTSITDVIGGVTLPGGTYPPVTTMGGSSLLWVGVGVVALWLFSSKSKGFAGG